MKIIDRSDSKQAAAPGSLSKALGRFIPSSNKPDTSALTVLTSSLERLLDDHYVLIKNLVIEEVQLEIPALLVGPTGLIVFYTIEAAGVFRCQGDSWEQLKNQSHRDVTARPNPVKLVLEMTSTLRTFLAKRQVECKQIEPIIFLANPEIPVEAVAGGEPGYEELAHAPILHTRPGSLDRCSDLPLLAWVETRATADGGRELRYSVIFSHEDGGTPLDRLMATWGRATDIELVYAIELDPAGDVRREEYQGKDHVFARFEGRKEGLHPVLHVSTSNNMVRDRGRSTPRVVPAPVPFSLDGVSREAVMDAHPWTYRVSGQEVRRDGLVSSAPGRRRIRDPRRFAYLEACGEVRDARIAFDLGFAGPGGRLRWGAPDARGGGLRVGRTGCVRAAVAMPEGSALPDARLLRLRAHTRPPRRGEKPLPRGGGSARVDRVNRLFALGPDDAPGASLLAWSAGADLRPDGDPVEIPIVGRLAASGGSVPAAVPLALP